MNKDKKLNIEISVSNMTRLEAALCAEFRKQVSNLSITNHGDKYRINFVIAGIIGIIMVEVDRNGTLQPGYPNLYYKVSCDNCVWYLTYEDISVIKQFATGVGNTVREMIKRAM